LTSGRRHAGLLLPLFSATSRSSWGIGDLSDIAHISAWVASAGFDRLMLLPVFAVENGEASPYASMTAMAIDPIYIDLDRVPEFQRAGGVSALSPEARQALDHARAASSIRYDLVRRAKTEALDIAFARFLDDEWTQLTGRGAALAGYLSRERWWLDDYALYRAVAEALDTPAWRDWSPPLRDRDARALDEARRQLARPVLRHQFLQWIAEGQWQEAKRAAAAHGVAVFGDMPFMVGANSPDVWARPAEFMFDVSLGVPPDAFSDEGQDWGHPTYNWQAIAATDFAWIRQRARRMAALFDGYRVDHLVGLYRTFGRPAAGEPFFNPSGEAAQTAQGEHILGILLATGATIVAEDLGLVPDFVRASLARLGVPGCKVLRWERDWHLAGHPFLEPAAYPEASAALSGTHDTETMAEWWDGAPIEERAAVLELPGLREAGLSDPEQPWTNALRDALLATLFGAGSRELFLPVQDVFGWPHRINTPGTVSDLNWTWRFPWAVDDLAHVPEASERAVFCRAISVATGRGL